MQKYDKKIRYKNVILRNLMMRINKIVYNNNNNHFFIDLLYNI